jgi:ribosomal protein S18 acetylase RimI-like enzyme
MTTTRRATGDDLEFLEQVFVLAADWRPGHERGAEHWRADASMGRYVGGFPRDTDFGFIATREHEDVGAIWARYFTEDDPGYGYVDDATPELTLGVVPGRRGEGIGRALLNVMLAASTTDLSLSVEDGNPAIELYRKSGFVEVGRFGEATTMLHRRRVR